MKIRSLDSFLKEYTTIVTFICSGSCKWSQSWGFTVHFECNLPLCLIWALQIYVYYYIFSSFTFLRAHPYLLGQEWSASFLGEIQVHTHDPLLYTCEADLGSSASHGVTRPMTLFSFILLLAHWNGLMG